MIRRFLLRNWYFTVLISIVTACSSVHSSSQIVRAVKLVQNNNSENIIKTFPLTILLFQNSDEKTGNPDQHYKNRDYLKSLAKEGGGEEEEEIYMPILHLERPLDPETFSSWPENKLLRKNAYLYITGLMKTYSPNNTCISEIFNASYSNEGIDSIDLISSIPSLVPSISIPSAPLTHSAPSVPFVPLVPSDCIRTISRDFVEKPLIALYIMTILFEQYYPWIAQNRIKLDKALGDDVPRTDVLRTLDNNLMLMKSLLTVPTFQQELEKFCDIQEENSSANRSFSLNSHALLINYLLLKNLAFVKKDSRSTYLYTDLQSIHQPIAAACVSMYISELSSSHKISAKINDTLPDDQKIPSEKMANLVQQIERMANLLLISDNIDIEHNLLNQQRFDNTINKKWDRFYDELDDSTLDLQNFMESKSEKDQKKDNSATVIQNDDLNNINFDKEFDKEDDLFLGDMSGDSSIIDLNCFINNESSEDEKD